MIVGPAAPALKQTESTDTSQVLAETVSSGAVSKDKEKGFTLVEVMVVVLIIGILLSIGVPTFLGARGRAQDRSAQSNLRTSQTTALILFTDHSSFTQASAGYMARAEPSLYFRSGDSPSIDTRYISVTPNKDGTEYGAAILSDSGTCFYIHLRSNGSTLYGSGTSACTGTVALEARGSSW